MAARKRQTDGFTISIQGGWEFKIPRPGRYFFGVLTVVVPTGIALWHRLFG